jgi:site-specific DNA-cytosine methylase
MIAANLAQRVFNAFMFCGGIGGGALGFAEAEDEYKRVRARFEVIGSVDVDPVANAAFERIVGVPATTMDLFTREQFERFHRKCIDARKRCGICSGKGKPPAGWREVTGEDIRRAAGGRRPNVVFSSSPCKGLSALLNAAAAASDEYQALNELVTRTIHLTMDAWGDDPPEFILIENVPRILTRGRELLDEIKALLDFYGYASVETTHDCGELGGLAQHRQRFLLVARHRAKVRPHLWEPPRQRVRGVGEVLGQLPMPDDPRLPMHRLPRLKWLTWVRLALIEAGSDWRSLNRLEVVDGHLRDIGIVPMGAEWYGSVLGVGRWSEPVGTVTGRAGVTTGQFSVADPRCNPEWAQHNGGYGSYGLTKWDDPAHAVSGTAHAATGWYNVADPRLACDATDREHRRFNNCYRVVDWRDPAQAVTSGGGPSAGGQAVADPRVASKTEGGEYASARHYGVLRWKDASPAVTGSACHDNGAHSVADPRLPLANEKLDPPPVIVSLDGTWHRPFTTLDLAALQGYPVLEQDFRLDGSDSLQREHIGNSVPVPAARAIATTMLRTLLMHELGESFALKAEPIWVNPWIARGVAIGVSLEVG